MSQDCRLSVACAVCQALTRQVLLGQASCLGTQPRNNATLISKRFGDLEVYQLSLSLQRAVFELTELFPKEERYAPAGEIRRSSRAAGANIAEAWHKRRYPVQFASKLTDADAECGETRHWLKTGLDCESITAVEFEKLMELCLSIGANLGHMIQNAGNWQPR